MAAMPAPIPLPADDADHAHTLHAALASLSAATSSFDATMDALSDQSARHRRRATALERRMERFRGHLRRLDEIAAAKMRDGEALDDRICMAYCPASHEEALLGMQKELAEVKEALDSSEGGHPEHATTAGTRSAVRSAADAAVRAALRRDVRNDNGRAVPSDAWLDRPSAGLGVGRAAEAAARQRRVPALLTHSGDADYRRALEALARRAAEDRRGEHPDRLEVTGGVGGGDDESVYSAASQLSALSVASSGTRRTAGQRRRWHRRQQLQKGQGVASPTQLHPGLSTHVESPAQASAGRQQSMAGSGPYLAEVLHDSYGIGEAPPKGLVDCSGFSGRCSREGGTEFYPPTSHLPGAMVFNTTRSGYGAAMGPTPTPSSAALGVAGDGTKEHDKPPLT
ncbi:hypothetical protein ACHAXT_000891 [Thalassiosira profunda]